MNIKKSYTQPAIKIFELQHRYNLLQTSLPETKDGVINVIYDEEII